MSNSLDAGRVGGFSLLFSCDVYNAAMASVDRECALSQWSLCAILRIRRPLVRYDKMRYLERTAASAQAAASCSDSKKLYTIVKSLAGPSAHPISTIRDETGRLLTDAGEVRSRW